MSDTDLKCIDELTNRLNQSKLKLRQDILKHLNIDEITGGVDIYDLLNDINKTDPNIIELNNKLKEFKTFLNKANASMTALMYSVQDISWTTENYQQYTCNHKFTQQQDLDVINGELYNYRVCNICGHYDY